MRRVAAVLAAVPQPPEPPVGFAKRVAAHARHRDRVTVSRQPRRLLHEASAWFAWQSLAMRALTATAAVLALATGAAGGWQVARPAPAARTFAEAAAHDGVEWLGAVPPRGLIATYLSLSGEQRWPAE